MPMSGNVGDTLNVMPLLSGIYKSTSHQISLVVRDKMRMFTGLKEFLLLQECVCSVKFESEITLDNSYNIISLVDNFTQHPTRPWETVRLEEYFRHYYDIDFTVDDDFVFAVDENIDTVPSGILVGDRMNHPNMDQRRKFNVLKESGQFNIDDYYFLDYNVPMATNAAYIKYTREPVVSTFTGISVIADLLNKECHVLWGEDLRNWDNKPIEYSFNKHFYRDRKCKLMHLNNYDKVTI